MAPIVATFLAGCVTSGDQEAMQFQPMPAADYGQADLDPVQRETLRDTLERAQLALEAANIAHEDRDEAKALREYTRMLEILADANLDPAIFYSLRTEFESILDTSFVQARAYERDPTLTWREQVTYLPSVTGLQYPTPLPERVLREIESIVEVYPSNFERGLERAARYQPYIRQQFIDAGLPEDLMWLAMVESQYTPRIVSRAGAGGMWQFMGATGRRYGLNADYYVDDRYEWKKSTQAAIAYLKDLHKIFDGDWALAVSAYNMGEGGLERAIAANGGNRDLWTLIETPPAANRIRLETKKFYPKLLASAIVGKDPERYGMDPNPLSVDDTVYVRVDGSYLLKDIEQAAGLSTGELANVNQQLLRGMTPPDRPVDIMVPRGARSAVEDALKRLPKLRPDTHIVRRGETPSGIASLYNVPVSELMRVNNVRSARSLQIGQRLVIPGRVSSGSFIPADNAEGRTVHTVQRGESLSKIADRYRVSVSNLQSWNALGRSTRIHVGDRLYVSAPGTASAASSASTKTITHTVRSGESVSVIADKYNVRTGELLGWNNLNSRSVLQIGQKLTVRVPETSGNGTTPGKEESTPDIVIHTVQRGESASVIADKYNVSLRDLYRWNGWEGTPVLQIGQQVTVQRD